MNTHLINQSFDEFNKMKILVIGDIMIDTYVWGKVSRISPEAPVPIIDIKKREHRLGGAANVALNIKSLGANPIICGVIGNDNYGQLFKELLDQENLSSEGIVTENNRPTTNKTRVIASHQQLIRIDEEITTEISKITSDEIIATIKNIIEKDDIQAIIFEDYDKGLLNTTIIDSITEIASKNNIITTVDPKKKNFFNYKNVTVFKPNLKELNEGMKLELSAEQLEGIHSAATKLMVTQNIQHILITLGENGMLLADKVKYTLIPAEKRDIADVSGAGDTVISVLTLCMSSGCSFIESGRIANLAGGLVCEKVGVVPISRNLLRNEAFAVFTK